MGGLGRVIIIEISRSANGNWFIKIEMYFNQGVRIIFPTVSSLVSIWIPDVKLKIARSQREITFVSSLCFLSGRSLILT